MRVTRSLIAGLAVLVVLLGGTAFAFASVGLGGSPSHLLRIDFPSADGLVSGSDVLESGARVGSVQSIEPTTSSSALVVAAIDGAHWPLHRGLTVDIRPKSLLGEKYVDLHDGPGSATVYDASQTYMASSSADPVELDQFINSLDPTTRTAVRVLLDDLGAGVAGRGQDLNAAIAAGKSDLANLAVTGQTLNNRDADLDRILVGLDGVLNQITTDAQLTQISQLIGNAQNTLSDIESVQSSFSRQFTDANTTLADLNTALDGAVGNGSLAATIDAASKLIPALGSGSQSEAALLDQLGQGVLTGQGATIPSGTGYSSLKPIDALILGLLHGPTTLGGAIGTNNKPITRICLELPITELPAGNATCDNPQSQLPNLPSIPVAMGGGGGAVSLAEFLGS
ncbi:MAG TPA: MlaD family protein [Candidatus Dormibacteraeota bacterium]